MLHHWWEFDEILKQCCTTGGDLIRGGEISKMYTCPRTSGFKKTLVRTNALLVRTFTNTNASTCI